MLLIFIANLGAACNTERVTGETFIKDSPYIMASIFYLLSLSAAAATKYGEDSIDEIICMLRIQAYFQKLCPAYCAGCYVYLFKIMGDKFNFLESYLFIHILRSQKYI